MAISQRDIVLARDNHTCQECGATPDKLHVHHLAYGTDDLADLITLCPACHKLRHKTRPSTRAARATTVATYKLPEKDMALLANLSKRYGVSRPAIVRMAIRYLDEHGPLRGREATVDNYTRRMEAQENAMLAETDNERPPYMWTSDRTAQVNWIMELAGDLHSNWQGSVSDYADAETYAETIVTAYLERMAEEREPMPDWWDEHDRGLLVRFVENMVATDDPDEVEYGI